MNLKKRLQQRAEKDAEALLTEEDELFIRQLAESQPILARPQAKKSKKFWAVIGSVATVVLAAVIVFPAVFVNRDNNQVHYQEANIRETACTFEDMQTDLKYFQIESEFSDQLTVILNYDSVSSDKLYYSVEGSTVISKYKLYLVINENYEYNFELGENLSTQTLSDYSIKYAKSSMSGFDKAQVNYLGYIQLQTEIVYIEYQQLFDIGEQAFFDDIESIIKVKN